MGIFKNMPTASVIVVIVILGLFAAAVAMLFAVCATYRRQLKMASVGDSNRSHLLHNAEEEFKGAYKLFAQETNTPAIITSAINTNMGYALFCERFLNSAVGLFVTLGLFGTFLGLSMSVTSLTELLSFNTGADWQIVLNSVGDGLMEALGGMGVAFSTSLVGVACSIALTILKAIFNPESIRSALESEMELWLDHRVPARNDFKSVSKDAPKDDSEAICRMIAAMNNTSATMDRTLRASTESMLKTMDGFNNAVGSFNQGIRDFSEFDYNLRGTVERMDVAVRELSNTIRRVTHGSERSDKA